jgi:2-hydroxy-6-oxo-6-(2'-carboxyphenyl)-hexa-2,4-dienoate hydrolase
MPLSGERYVDVGGIRTRCFEKGEGEPIILLHGSYFGADLSADCAANWSRNFDGVSQFGRVLALDRLGQGYTDNPRRIEDYTMAAVVEHVAGFIRTLGLRDVHLVGHSRGGYVACRTALDHPDLIKTCVLVDSGTLAPGTTPMEVLFKDAPNPRLTRESQRWVLQRYSFGYEHIDDEWVNALAGVAATAKYKEALSIVDRSPYNDHLIKQKAETFDIIRNRGMQKPTLVIWSFNDPTAVLERGQALFAMIADKEPRAQMHIINKAGHFNYRERPKEFNAVLQSWVGLNR